MPSIISNIFGGYKQSLDLTRQRFENMISKRQQNAQKFYQSFFKNMMLDYSYFKDGAKRRQLKTIVRQIFNSDKITFAAIDGTNFKEAMEDYMIFFGGAYAVKGEINFEGDPPVTKYKKWSSKEDISMVAYVPVPYADLNDISENQFIMEPDSQRFDLLSIHSKLMQLAEVFLLYTIVDNPTYRPDFVIWDQSMSGVMTSNEEAPEKISMVDNTIMGTKVNFQDIVIALSHPYEETLDVPRMRSVEPYDYILRRLMKDRTVDVSKIATEFSIDKTLIVSKIKRYLLESYSGTEPIAKQEGDIIKINPQWLNSWSNSIALFKNFCQRLFNQKDSTVLIYERFDDGGIRRERWISPTDLTYLIAIGIRAVTELAWKNKVMLVGIVKDSSSTYFSQRYLGVMREIKSPGYDFKDVLLPWSDRIFLQSLPTFNGEITSPWSTIEYDSVFMTLHVQRNPETKLPEIVGMRGNILNKERLYLKSLAQFYIKRDGKKMNMGHVIFIDRLILPHIEKKLKELEIKTPLIGTVKPFFFKDNKDTNVVQEIMMYILNILTKNLYPEVIGYPDPLHKADWGAKSMNRKVSNMIKSSGKFLKLKPLAKTLRQERGSRR